MPLLPVLGRLGENVSERFPIDVAVEAPRSAHARIELTAEGKSIGGSQVQLAPGLNRLRLQATYVSDSVPDAAASAFLHALVSDLSRR